MVTELKLTPKEPRDLDTVKREYANLIMITGTLQYEIDCKKRDLELNNQTLRDLNFEYLAAKKKASEEADKTGEVKNAQ